MSFFALNLCAHFSLCFFSRVSLCANLAYKMLTVRCRLPPSCFTL
uniref:Uncharacterized protein n=1 Tax=Setaria viridis TaxID=4556 RepID=A0A4U6U390_SETVI|nr:hypothetical protein SEVIR_6G137316v2 [Setaria viridis]